MRETQLRPQTAVDIKGEIKNTENAFTEKTQVIGAKPAKQITTTQKLNWTEGLKYSKINYPCIINF